jgi:hypothetical protein
MTYWSVYDIEVFMTYWCIYDILKYLLHLEIFMKYCSIYDILLYLWHVEVSITYCSFLWHIEVFMTYWIIYDIEVFMTYWSIYEILEYLWHMTMGHNPQSCSALPRLADRGAFSMRDVEYECILLFRQNYFYCIYFSIMALESIWTF